METAAKILAAGTWLAGDRVGVVRDDAAGVSPGGIIIPEQAQDRPLRGRCVMLGKGLITDDKQLPKAASKWDRAYIGLNLGDYMTFTKYGGQVHEVPLGDGSRIKVEVMQAFDIFIVGQ